MKPISENIKNIQTIKRMFPYQMKVYWVSTFIDTSLPPSQQVPVKTEKLLGEIPCSIQNTVSSNGDVLQGDYLVLSPCIDMSLIDEWTDDSMYKLEITANGKVLQAEGTEILSIDNTEVFKVDNYKIGCKIKVHKVSLDWAW